MATEIDRLEIIVEAEAKKASAELDKLIGKLGQVSTAMRGVSGFGKGVSASSINGTANSLSRYTKSTASAISGTRSLTSQISRMAFAFYSLKRVISGIGDSIKKSMDFTETINLFQTTFKKIGMEEAESIGYEWGSASANEFSKGYIDRAQKFNNLLTASLGLDPNTMMNYQAVFAQMSNSMGLVTDSALNISETFTMLGNDIASLWNIDTASAMQKLQSGLAGQIRPLRQLGIDISQTSLEMTALKYGITDNITQMSQAAKVQLRWLSVMDQAEVAFGDMAKTIDSPANQLRILQQQWTNLSRAIGNVFLPIVSAMLPYINAVVIALRNMINSLATAMGYELPDYTDSNIYTDVTGDIEGLTDATDEATKANEKFKKSMYSGDELNILSNNKSSGAIDSGSGYGNLDDAIQQKTESYMKKFREELDKMENTVGKLGAKLEPVTKALSDLWEEVKPFGENIGKGLDWFNENVLTPMADIVIDETVPNFLYALEGALKVINTVADKMEQSKADDTIIGFLVNLQKSKLQDISNWFKNIGDAFMSLSGFIEAPNWKDLLGYVKNIFDVASRIAGLPDFGGIFKSWSEYISGTNLGVLGEKLMGWFGNLKTSFSAKGKEIITGIMNGWNEGWTDFSAWLSGLDNKVSASFGSLINNFFPKGGQIITGIKDGWNDGWESFKAWLKKIPSMIMNAVGDLFKIGEEMIKSLIAGFKSIAFPTIKFEGGVTPGGKGHSSGYGQFATGGYPTPGQLFIANEPGNPELIGNVGGRTAVMNNNQIVDAVSQGVAMAVASVLVGQSSNNQVQPINLVVDSEVLASAVARGNQILDRRTNPSLRFV